MKASRRIRGEASPGLRLRVDAKFARNGGGFSARVSKPTLFCGERSVPDTSNHDRWLILDLWHLIIMFLVSLGDIGS